jgi:hypothetical protein
MVWDIIERKDTDEEKEWGAPRRVFKGNKSYFYKYLISLIFMFK